MISEVKLMNIDGPTSNYICQKNQMVQSGQDVNDQLSTRAPCSFGKKTLPKTAGYVRILGRLQRI